MIPRLSLGLRPPEIAQQGYKLVYQITRNDDPFRKAKVEANQAALALYTRLKKVVADSEEPLLTACKLAIGGNSIDLGPNFEQVDMDSIVKTAMSSPLAINDYREFRNSINNSRRILYLGDNAGEIVFDRVLIEELHKVKELEIDFVVRERPIINDITLDDAMAVGMDRVARIVPSGSDAPATILSQCSSKEEPDNTFFLLRAKCPLLAELLGVSVGDAVLKQNLVRTKAKGSKDCRTDFKESKTGLSWEGR